MADPDCTVLAAETEEDAGPARPINGCPAAAGVRADHGARMHREFSPVPASGPGENDPSVQHRARRQWVSRNVPTPGTVTLTRLSRRGLTISAPVCSLMMPMPPRKG